MKIALVLAAGGLLTCPLSAWSQQQQPGEDWATPPPPTPPPDQVAPPAPADPGQPEEAAPGEENQDPAPEDATGQWSYTSQYGWAWLPYAQNYTYVPDDGSIAYEYAYFPTSGWSWVESPWVLGIGPRPYWGNLGYGRYSWYAHPWFTPGSYRGSYNVNSGYGSGSRSGSSVHGASPVHQGAPQLRRTAQPATRPSLEAAEAHPAASHSSGRSHGGRR